MKLVWRYHLKALLPYMADPDAPSYTPLEIREAVRERELQKALKRRKRRKRKR